MTQQRGQWQPLAVQAEGIATWHPSYVLRTRGGDARERAYAELVKDLRQVAARLAAG